MNAAITALSATILLLIATIAGLFAALEPDTHPDTSWLDEDVPEDAAELDAKVRPVELGVEELEVWG